MELSQEVYYYYKIPLLKLHLDKYIKNAQKVIVSEYNRAQITKTWFKLDKLPFIYPNKPYYGKKFDKKMPITSSEKNRNIIKKIKSKKIILYQGIISEERPLDVFIKAIEKLGDEYAFVAMGGDENIYKKYEGCNFYFIPFVEPSLHLEITSYAYIGILTYVPIKNMYSPLNAIYCAPNKLYEYSMFSIPMLGNNIPGLKYPFEQYNMGKCIDTMNENDIIENILEIEKNYLDMSCGAKKFYEATKIEKIAEKIILD